MVAGQMLAGMAVLTASALGFARVLRSGTTGQPVPQAAPRPARHYATAGFPSEPGVSRSCHEAEPVSEEILRWQQEMDTACGLLTRAPGELIGEISVSRRQPATVDGRMQLLTLCLELAEEYHLAYRTRSAGNGCTITFTRERPEAGRPGA